MGDSRGESGCGPCTGQLILWLRGSQQRAAISGDRPAGEQAGAVLLIHRHFAVDQHVGNPCGLNARVFETALVDDAFGVEYDDIGELAFCQHAPVGQAESLCRVLRKALDDLLQRIAQASAQPADDPWKSAECPRMVELPDRNRVAADHVVIA